MSSIEIYWEDINATQIPNKFKIYKSTATMDVNNLPTPLVVDLPKEQRSYVDNDVTFGNTYYYIVAAYTNNNEILGDEQKVIVKENMYFSSSAVIYKISHDSTTKIPAKFKSLDSSIVGIDSDASGNVYSLTSTSTLYKHDYQGNEIYSVSLGESCYCLIVDQNQNVFVGGNNKIKKYDATGAHIGDITWSMWYDGDVVNINIDQQQRLILSTTYLNNSHGSILYKIEQNGVVIFSERIEMNSSYYAGGIAIDDEMNIYHLIYYSGRTYIHKYDPLGNVIYTNKMIEFDYGSNYNSNYGIAYDTTHSKLYISPERYVYVSDTDGNNIQRVGSSSSRGLLNGSRNDVYAIGTIFQRLDNTTTTHSFRYNEMRPDSVAVVEPGRYINQFGLYTPPA